jgi:hypothetical protein
MIVQRVKNISTKCSKIIWNESIIKYYSYESHKKLSMSPQNARQIIRHDTAFIVLFQVIY